MVIKIIETTCQLGIIMYIAVTETAPKVKNT